MGWTGRRIAAGVGAVLLVGALGACTAAGTEGASSSSRGAAPQAAAPAPAVADEGRSAGGPDGAGAAPAVPPVGAASTVDRALVRTADVTLDVPDLGAALADVRAAAVGAGGFVAQEQSGGTYGSLTLRVPAASLDAVIERVVGLAEPGSPVQRSTTVVDATEEVVDLDARRASQQASVDRVRGLLAQASTIGDVVAIESELTQREAELDSLAARLAAVRDQVALSTLAVSLSGPADPVLAAADDAPPGFLDGLAAGWEGVLVLGRGTGAFLGFVLPFVPVLALLAAAGVGLARLLRARRTAP